MTRSCAQRQFLLRPDKETVNAVIYCLAVAAQKYEIDILAFIQMSNHLHEAIFDRYGNSPAFFEHFHKLLAKCVNALRGRWGSVFAGEQTSVVQLTTTEDIVRKLVYVITNPVKDNLVEHVADWPGANGYRAMMTRTPLRATRPKQFFSERGTMPAEVTLWVGIPPELGDHDTICSAVQAGVEAFEQNEARERARTGRKVLGRNQVLRQSWRGTPEGRQVRRGLRPTIAGRDLWVRLEMIQRRREFVRAYRKARASLLAGSPIPFPMGTYWLPRFTGVPVATEILN